MHRSSPTTLHIKGHERVVLNALRAEALNSTRSKPACRYNNRLWSAFLDYFKQGKANYKPKHIMIPNDIHEFKREWCTSDGDTLIVKFREGYCREWVKHEWFQQRNTQDVSYSTQKLTRDSIIDQLKEVKHLPYENFVREWNADQKFLKPDGNPEFLKIYELNVEPTQAFFATQGKVKIATCILLAMNFQNTWNILFSDSPPWGKQQFLRPYVLLEELIHHFNTHSTVTVNNYKQIAFYLAFHPFPHISGSKCDYRIVALDQPLQEVRRYEGTSVAIPISIPLESIEAVEQYPLIRRW